MSHEPETDGDDLPLRKILRSIDADAAVPDREILESLRHLSAAEFDAHFAGNKSISEPKSQQALLVSPKVSSSTIQVSQSGQHESSRNRSSTLAMLTALVAVASMVLVAMWFVSYGPAPVDAALVPFSKILEELRGAGPLEFQLVKQGTVSQFLVRDPRHSRKEEAAQRYDIAAGTRLWKIDKTFTASDEKHLSLAVADDHPVDLLELLDIGVTDGSALLRARPVERAVFPPRESEARAVRLLDSPDDRVSRHENRKAASENMPRVDNSTHPGNCLVYRVELPGKQGRIRVEAFVNESDHRLVGIFAWPAKSRRNVGVPLAEMRLIAMTPPVADEKLRVLSRLVDDGRIGKVTQSQGIVMLRPMLARRWTPVGNEAFIKPGDWLRTERRGANAVLVRLSSDVALTLGPGTSIEFVSPSQARIHEGIVQVQSESVAAEAKNAADRGFTLLAPRDGSREFTAVDKKVIRVDRDEKLVDVQEKPVWLAGFEGTTNNESLGSLIVNLPDGRNEPLTVGYHHVSVEIRDQIARTTIEESFVNHTASRLEGIFHFPLPQDASISGFGMWIGNELVEADIVEKQRAREIYETILRERRDPGLLEWTGGNIFKARVFPIEANSEKRIKIVYTQVLPLRSNQYRYVYGLRSELLRTRPLRELSLDITVNSALALKSVTCPTHPVRSQQTQHSARVEFAAQDYTPNRDFEVTCQIDGQQSDVVVVPHRRGDDGYFLVQITPPFDGDGTTPAGANLHEVIPDGKPLHLLLLCDTSGSMDSEKRKQQSAFVDTVLSALGPDDRFQLAACDVDTVWSTAAPIAATAENRTQAAAFLDARDSLGWTNLDRAFDDVLKKAEPGSQIVYVGDGIVSSADTDPAAFVQRQRVRETREAKAATAKPIPDRDAISFHSIAVGNSYESVVMRGVASVGRGSMRVIGAEQTPQVVAREFLNEITRPGLRDLEIEFRGLKVAAVYPDQLPNLPAGTQQILVGRYLPDLKNEISDQRGEVIVTGMRGAKKVTFAGRVTFKDAEAGNSFIPRLWARSHLEHLLALGSGRRIQDDIVRLSEEFHIITPYTSLLVLETDADRARFGVQRRYEMRDGERFFAVGRDNANFELLQQQTGKAKEWRVGLRRQVLKGLTSLGRNPNAFSKQLQQRDRRRDRSELNVDEYSQLGRVTSWAKPGQDYFSRGDFGLRGLGGGMGGGMGGEMLGETRGEMRDFDGDFDLNGNLDSDALEGLQGLGVPVSGRMNINSFSDTTELAFSADPIGSGPIEAWDDFDSRMQPHFWGVDHGSVAGLEPEDDSKKAWFFRTSGRFLALNKSMAEPMPGLDMDSAFGFETRSALGKRAYAIDGLDLSDRGTVSALGFDLSWKGGRSSGRSYYDYGSRPDYVSWIGSIFPTVDRPPARPARVLRDPESWSAEALELAKSLLRTESLTTLAGGVEISREVESFNANWNRSSGRTVDQTLYSPTAWLTRGFNPQEQTLVNYCDARERGVYSLAFLLGRSRASSPDELKSPPLPLNDFSMTSVAQGYRDYAAQVEPAADGLLTLILTLRDSTSEVRFTIDVKRHAVLKRQSFYDGKPTGAMSFEDFVEVAGSWWATKVVEFDDRGRPTTETRLAIKALTAEEFANRMAAELNAKSKVQFIHLPFASLRTARQQIEDGRASFDDRLRLILHNAQLQQWDEMWTHVEAAEKLAVDKPGIRWIRTALLATIRRNEEALSRLSDEATRLAAKPSPDEVFIAQFMLNQANSLSAAPEFARLLQSLKPMYARPEADRVPSFAKPKAGRERATELANAEIQRQIMTLWTDREISSLDALSRPIEAITLLRQVADETPWERHRQELYANRLAGAGEVAAAHQWLRTTLARPEWDLSEKESLRSAIAGLYRQHNQWTELLKWTTEWIATNPTSASHDSAYIQHLSALIHRDQLDAASQLVDGWFRDSRVAGKLNPVQRARLEIAIRFAEGNVYDMNFQRTDERWFDPLAETARFFARSPQQFDLAQRCFSNHYLLQSDVGDQLRGEWLAMLVTDLEKLNSGQIDHLVSWALSGRIELTEPINGRKQMDASEVPREIWKRIADQLKLRWSHTQNQREKDLFGETLRTIYANRFADTELLPFLRERIATAPAEQKSADVAALFEALLTANWIDAIETEAFVRWRELTDKPRLADRLPVELPALLRLNDAMLSNRIARGEQQLNDQGELNKLTRKQLAAKRAEIRRAARSGLSERLGREITQEEQIVKPADPVAEQGYGRVDWMKIEQVWLNVGLDQDLPAAERECWKILGEVPPQPVAADANAAAESDDGDQEDGDQGKDRQDWFDSALRQRAFTTVMDLAVRKRVNAAGVDRLLKYVDHGIATKPVPQDQDIESVANDTRAFWRQKKFRLLVALDRPDELERQLRDWIRGDVSTGPWRQSLARLVAERGKLDEAIAQFEACQRDKLLSAADFQLLADWYLAVNRRSDYERCRVEALEQMPEGSLAQILNQFQNRQRSDSSSASELDDRTRLAIQVLLKKSAHPENYFWQLRSIYAATRDFRLLQMLPDGMLGRSPQQVYAFLAAIQNAVLSELRNEAAADEILTRIKSLQEADRTSTDRRALDLLEVMVERASSEILNQPGPHIEACLTAMQRAFQRDWADGELLMMSQFLVDLGTLPNEQLQSEQIRELRSIQQLAPQTTRERLQITVNLYQMLFWNYGKKDEAVREMEVESKSFLRANQGHWPYEDDELLGRYVQMLQDAGRHADGEKILQSQLTGAQHDQERSWLRDRLLALYVDAFEDDGAVSIGTGRTNLFRPIVNLTLAEIAAASHEHTRYIAITRLNTVFHLAGNHKLPGTAEALQQFAFEKMPAVLRLQEHYYRNTVTSILDSVATILDSKSCLRYVVERMEQWPQRFEIRHDNSWQAFGGELASRRKSVGQSELDDRILKLVIAHLKQQLRNGESASQAIYQAGNYQFWAEKSADFAKAAEEVLNERRTSGRRALIVASYLRDGLHLNPRAVEILQIAHSKGLLGEFEQHQLVRWLRDDRRYAEMIPVLDSLLAAHPDKLTYRVELMVAYFQTKRPQQMQDLILQTHDHFHTSGRWTEQNIASFARACEECEEWGRARQYYTEAISLHQRYNPASGVNDETLSNVYRQLARVESRLHLIDEAVTSASAAIVCWGARHENRQDTIDTLREVLNDAEDLDAYVERVDAQAKQTGQDSPLLRKMIGEIYRGRNEFTKAITQLNIAIELQPHDQDVHQALIACYDATGHPDLATRQLLKLIDDRQHDLPLYQQLATRLKDNEAQADRAATSMVESAPNEAESHAALAELWQSQNRWDEAIPQWQQVARLRKLEPTGLLKLTEAQLHEKQWDAAKDSIQKLNRTEWPSQFHLVPMQVRQLEERLPK